MRWLFADPLCTKEMQFRDEMLQKIDDWWQAFERDQEMLLEICGNNRIEQIVEWVDQNFKHFSQFRWEVGRAGDGKTNNWSLSAGAIRHLRPVVLTMIECAPQFPNWEFHPFLLAKSFEVARKVTDSRIPFKPDLITVNVVQNNADQVDITLQSPEFLQNNIERAGIASYFLCEDLLGEEVLDHWVGKLRVLPGHKIPVDQVPLRQLPEAVNHLRQIALSRLPDQPCWEIYNKVKWSDLNIRNPGSAPEYVKLQDRYGWSTMLVTMVRNTVGDVFASERFSKFGEAFCYLKVDGDSNVRVQSQKVVG